MRATTSMQAAQAVSETCTTEPRLVCQHPDQLLRCTAPQRAGGSAGVSVTALRVSTCGDQIDSHGAGGVGGPKVDVKGKAPVFVRGVGRACTRTHHLGFRVLKLKARGVGGPEVDVKGKAAVLVRGVGRACDSTQPDHHTFRVGHVHACGSDATMLLCMSCSKSQAFRACQVVAWYAGLACSRTGYRQGLHEHRHSRHICTYVQDNQRPKGSTGRWRI